MSVYFEVIECPRCGERCSVRRWYEDGFHVETDIKCKECSYHYNWSYGITTIDGEEE